MQEVIEMHICLFIKDFKIKRQLLKNNNLILCNTIKHNIYLGNLDSIIKLL
jgi:hypothetical protein